MTYEYSSLVFLHRKDRFQQGIVMYTDNSRTQETDAGGSKNLKSTFHRIRPCQREGGKKERIQEVGEGSKRE